LSDIFTLYEAFGEDIKNIKIAYVGDGNNVCNTWLVGAGLFGLNLFVATPEGYEPSSLYYQAGEGKHPRWWQSRKLYIQAL